MGEGEFSSQTDNDANTLKSLLDISGEDYESILNETRKEAYRAALRLKFSSGELESSKSKAAVLNHLCYRLNFPESDAREINNLFFERRLEQLVEKGVITDTDQLELGKLRV